MQKVALVTGANRGLGFEVCRQLGKAGYRIVATSRSARAAERAAGSLRAEGISAEPEELDVGSEQSVRALAGRLMARGEGIDGLVNNAGISMQGFNGEVAERTTQVNFGGALRVTDALLPLVRTGGRIVMVSSVLGEASALSPELRARFFDPGLDRKTLVALVAEFVRDVREGRHEERGWPSSAYRVSKIAMNALVRILAPELRAQGILVNAVCPGWVRTDMGGPGAPRSLEVGARSIAWGVLAPDGGPRPGTGGFFRDGEPLAW